MVFFNQVLKPIRELPKTKRFHPKLFLAEPSEFLSKNHAEFLRDFETTCFKAAKPRDTFFCDYSTFASKSLSRQNLLT